MSDGGILYSFRRCPYAIRARLALDAAGIALEVREVALKAKPPELLEASPQGTVPALVLPTGETLAESLEILVWALGQGSDGRELAAGWRGGEAAALVAECDGLFKQHLDGFRYGRPQSAASADPTTPVDPTRSTGASERQEAHRRAALAILRRWSARVDWPEPLEWAVLPFVRQFRLSDPEGFAADPGLVDLQRRLAAFEESEAFARVMAPPWAWRQPWRSPRWLYHLALEEDWQEARRQGVYLRSTRGKSLAEVGFLHASWHHQLEPTWRRFYADGPPLRLLTIDPERLAAAAIPVREEPAPESGELFPHIHGALPLDAVRLAERWEPPAP